MQNSLNQQFTKSLVHLHVDPRVQALRKAALEKHVPVMDDEGLHFLLTLLAALQPKKILEVGTAVGLSGAAMLLTCPCAKLTTIEVDEDRFIEAKKNLTELGVSERATCHLGDAGEILRMMDGQYDFVLLDGPKAQYPTYFKELKRLLRKGGTVFTDDVLMFGWTSGQTPVPDKHKLFIKHLGEWLTSLCEEEDFSTSVLDVGNGVALSVRV